MATLQYDLSNEYNLTQLLEKFEYDYILDIIEDKLENLSYDSTMIIPNIIVSFEQNFKMMSEQFPSDSQNIRLVREAVYREIIQILSEKFGLRFNSEDESIDLYTAAYYLYDFLIANRNNHVIRFYTSFIINNKNHLYNYINNNTAKKKDATMQYNKYLYNDQKFNIIVSNISLVIDFISTIDITLANIFESIYIDRNIVLFLDNCFADVRGSFFRDYYYNSIIPKDVYPIIITNIRLQLQQLIGNSNAEVIKSIISKENNLNGEQDQSTNNN